MYKIQFNFEQACLPPVILQNVAAGQSILEVALNHDIDLHHNCGGVCTCSTCHVYIIAGNNFLEEMSKREKDFMKRAANVKHHSRLSCQCLLQPGRGTIEVTVPDQAELF